MRPDRLPRPLRLAIFGLTNAVLLYLCLAPTRVLPKVDASDKAEHLLGWLTLAGMGLVLSPRRPRAIAAFAVLLGVVVEVLQGAMDLGRDADWRDAAADAAGVAVALALWAWARRPRRLS